MKQKVVIKVLAMNNHKSRSKALKIAVGCSGVESAGFKGDEKDQIEIKGEGVDAAELTNLLRKNVGHAELVSVGPVEDKKEDKKEEKAKEEGTKKEQGISYYCEGVRVPHCPLYEYRIVNQCQDPYCSIM